MSNLHDAKATSKASQRTAKLSLPLVTLRGCCLYESPVGQQITALLFTQLSTPAATSHRFWVLGRYGRVPEKQLSYWGCIFPAVDSPTCLAFYSCNVQGQSTGMMGPPQVSFWLSYHVIQEDVHKVEAGDADLSCTALQSRGYLVGKIPERARSFLSTAIGLRVLSRRGRGYSLRSMYVYRYGKKKGVTALSNGSWSLLWCLIIHCRARWFCSLFPLFSLIGQRYVYLLSISN